MRLITGSIFVFTSYREKPIVRLGNGEAQDWAVKKTASFGDKCRLNDWRAVGLNPTPSWLSQWHQILNCSQWGCQQLLISEWMCGVRGWMGGLSLWSNLELRNGAIHFAICFESSIKLPTLVPREEQCTKFSLSLDFTLASSQSLKHPYSVECYHYPSPVTCCLIVATSQHVKWCVPRKSMKEGSALAEISFIGSRGWKTSMCP